MEYFCEDTKMHIAHILKKTHSHIDMAEAHSAREIIY